LDVGVWGGTVSAGGIMIALGGPTAIGLCPGVLWKQRSNNVKDLKLGELVDQQTSAH